MYTYTYTYCHFKRKTEVQTFFFNPFTVCSLHKRKYFVCPFVDEETNGSYLFANRLNGQNGLNGLAHLQYENSHGWLYL